MNIDTKYLSGVRTLVRQCSTKVDTPRQQSILQSGFTLLEMILVLFLVGLMASATLMLTEGVEDQAKYDDTKRRMEIMRKAIVGDPTRTVNGGPEISGFVADMGRLPLCVAELLTAGDASGASFQSPCDGSEITAWQPDPSTGIGFGWRGPYLQVTPERNGDLRFRDGYGNSDTSDAQNSGWLWDLVDASDAITTDVSDAVKIQLQSEGFDASSAYPTTGPMDLISSSDWLLQHPITASLTIKNMSSTPQPTPNPVDILLRIYNRNNSIDSDVSFHIASDAISANGSITNNFTLDESGAISIGTRGYTVVCYELPPVTPDNFVIFDGDCSNAAPSSNDIKSFTVAPRQNITLDWIIQ